MEMLLGPCVAVATPSQLQKWTTSNSKRAHARASSPLGRIGPTLVHAGGLSIPCAPAADEFRLLLAVVGGSVCSDVVPTQQCSKLPHHMSIPTPDGASYRGMSKGSAPGVCGNVDAPRLCVFVFAPLSLVVVQLGEPDCCMRVRRGGEVVVLSPRRIEGPRSSDWIAVVEKRVVLALELTSLLRTGPHRRDLAVLGQIQGSKV